MPTAYYIAYGRVPCIHYLVHWVFPKLPEKIWHILVLKCVFGRPWKEETRLEYAADNCRWGCTRTCLPSQRLHSTSCASWCKIMQHFVGCHYGTASGWFWHRQEYPDNQDTYLHPCVGHNWIHWSWICTNLPSQWEVRCLQFWDCSPRASHKQNGSRWRSESTGLGMSWFLPSITVCNRKTRSPPFSHCRIKKYKSTSIKPITWVVGFHSPPNHGSSVTRYVWSICGFTMSSGLQSCGY